MSIRSRPTVYPDLDGLSGTELLRQVAGALLTGTLIVAVLILIVCAAAWAIASGSGNAAAAAKARAGLLVAVGAALLAGACLAWVSWLMGVGTAL